MDAMLETTLRADTLLQYLSSLIFLPLWHKLHLPLLFSLLLLLGDKKTTPTFCRCCVSTQIFDEYHSSRTITGLMMMTSRSSIHTLESNFIHWCSLQHDMRRFGRRKQRRKDARGWARQTVEQTRAYFALKGWVGSVEVVAQVVGIKVIVELPLGGEVTATTNTELREGKPRRRILWALDRLARMIEDTVRKWPSRCVVGVIGAAVEFKMFGTGFEITAKIAVASIQVEKTTFPTLDFILPPPPPPCENKTPLLFFLCCGSSPSSPPAEEESRQRTPFQLEEASMAAQK